jgi:two-component system phosphate regulon sensor histidine kinase PhoR
MNTRFKPVTRLSIIFILAVVLSGSVLTYFSINNISNLKELTEKRILEEQRELAARFSSGTNSMLEKVTSGLSGENMLPGEQKEAILKRTGEFTFIIQPFMLGREGQFIYPNFSGTQQTLSAARSSDTFTSSYNEGENAEFSEKNLRAAMRHYLSSLNHSSGRSDSARALNALGRISVKMNNFENAISYYSIIIKNYSAVTDANGLNYTYYALPQLLKITDQSNFQYTLPDIMQCLEKFETGEISLNYGTEELLSLVTDWLKGNTSVNQQVSTDIGNLVSRIEQQSKFINLYGNELSELVTKENPDNYPVVSNDFIAVNSISEGNQNFFLVNTSFENPVGFLINRNRLLDTIAKSDLQSGLEFDYRIDFPASFKSDEQVSNLVYTSQLHPWFPDQQIEISLVDENLIRDIISRRSWIYGLATVMLLVAMCLGVILILRDIRRERNLSRLRADFISNVTHELKTPLTSIRMYAESLILGRVKSMEGQKEYLSVIVNESDRLKRMVNNILEFSKMEKGRSEYHFVNSNLASVVKAAIDEMHHWFEREGFEIIPELDENIYADIDPEKIKQVLVNLFSNGIKYSTDTKKIFIRLFKETDHVCIEVEDRGIGIPEDKLSKIFEPFYRIGQEEGASGTGLGLTVVKEIIEAHNGTISVTSEIGIGSKFKIQVPLGGK